MRIMHIESTLMSGRKLDFDYDPEQLDRFHYFLAALKREGSVLDAGCHVLREWLLWQCAAASMGEPPRSETQDFLIRRQGNIGARS